MKAAGEPARLTYDSSAIIEAGDVIRTTTGRMYLVRTARIVGPPWLNSIKPTIRRWVVDTTVLPDDHELADDDTVHPLHWYRR